jgi:hypothetical protein
MLFKLNLKTNAAVLADRMASTRAAMPTWAAPSMADVERILQLSVGRQAASYTARSAVAQKLRPDGGVQNLLSLIATTTTSTRATLRLDIRGGEILHKGGTTATDSMIADKVVPGRPFMLIAPDARSDVFARMRESLIDAYGSSS